MMTARPAAGGGRWVSVDPGRLAGWVRGFADRHGPAEALADGDVVRLRAADGATAECHVPFPPLRPPSASHAAASPPRHEPGARPLGGPGGTRPGPLEALVAHAGEKRRVGVLLARLGGHAAGVFDGERLVTSKVGSRPVHGRSAAGGWSQRRFARRREKQAQEAGRAAADVAARVLGPHLPTLEAVVLGGDRRAVDALRGDHRLAGVFALETGPFLDVPDPRLAVLRETPRRFRAVRIRVVDPAGDPVAGPGD